MKFDANAKLNILLNIHGKYFNGYHSIESIMIPINLCDVLDIEVLPNSNDIIIQSTDSSIPTDERNILYKCGKLFQDHFKTVIYEILLAVEPSITNIKLY